MIAIRKCLYIIEKEEKKFTNFICQCKESSKKGFTIVARFSYNEKLKIRRMGEEININLKHYQEKILCLIFRKEILYLNDFH